MTFNKLEWDRQYYAEHKQDKRDWYLNNEKRIKAHRKTYKKEYFILSAAKNRAKSKDLEYDIDESDIIIPVYCPVLGIKLGLFNTKLSWDSPTLDRIDNAKGYIKGNVAIISWRANCLKGAATLEELEAIVAWVKDNLP